MAGFKDIAQMLGYNVLDDYKIDNDTLAGHSLDSGAIGSLIMAGYLLSKENKNTYANYLNNLRTKKDLTGYEKTIPEATNKEYPNYWENTSNAYNRGFGEFVKPETKETPREYTWKNILEKVLVTNGELTEQKYTPSNEIEKIKEMMETVNPATGAYNRGFGEFVKPETKETPREYTWKNILEKVLVTDGTIPDIKTEEISEETLNPATSAYNRGFGEFVKPKETPNELVTDGAIAIPGERTREGWWDLVGNPAALKGKLQEKEMPIDGAIAIPGERTREGWWDLVGNPATLKEQLLEKEMTTEGAIAIPNEKTKENVESLTKTSMIEKPIEEKNDDGKNREIYPPLVIPEGEDNMPTLQDVSKENTEYQMDYSGLLDWLMQEQQARYAREDEIRKETQEREDTAYQRAVEDARKAGINVNLMEIQPAQSGGGISTASGMYSGMLESAMQGHSNRFINSENVASQEYIAELNNATKILEAQINNNFKGSENDKQRILDLIGEIISGAAMIYAFKKGK